MEAQAVLGSLAPPVNRFSVVLGYAFAIAVHRTKVALRLRMSALSQRLPEPKSFLVIARFVSVDSILPIPRHHGSGEQHECGQGGEEGAHA